MKVPALAIAAAAALTLTLGGCGNIAQNAAEKAMENALSSDGTNVDIEDGKVKVENSEGSIEIGDGTTLPSDWPSDVPTPEGFNLQSALTSDSADGKTFTASYSTDGDKSDVVDAYVQSFVDAGWKKEADMGGLYSLTKGKVQVDIIGGFTDGATSIVINVGPKLS